MAAIKPPMVEVDRDDLLAREIIRENTGVQDPELALIRDFEQELDLRLEQVKVYYPIVDLLRRRKSESELERVVPELSFLLLSYLIYEGKLKHRGLTFQDLEAFFAKAWSEILTGESTPENLRQLVTALMDGLQNSGRNFSVSTYNFQTFRERYVKFLDIKQGEDGVLYYSITDQGVDFYLRTKEFPEETKVTINLLLFQKQMEKGAFGYAYETVHRLNMEVRRKKDQKYSLLEALMYGRIDSGEAYNRYHKGIMLQFEEEAELFASALQNVNQAYSEYVERINSGDATEKEKRVFTLIKIIEKEIGRAQTLHTELLKEAVVFTREYDQVLEVRRKAIFSDKFAFQGEFEKLIADERPPEILKFLFEPLLQPKMKKRFNPLSVLEPQRVAKAGVEAKETQPSAINTGRITFDTTVRNRVNGNFVFYAARLLEELQVAQEPLFLEAFCDRLIARYGEDCVYNGDFLSFIIEINRDKKIGEYVREINFTAYHPEVDPEPKTIEAVFVQALLGTDLEVAFKGVLVRSFPQEEVELLPGLKITNLQFTGVNER